MRNITNLTPLPPRNIDRQIESLKNLPARRLEDGAKPIDPEGLEWLRQSLLTRIAFDDVTMPYLYPTEEGNVQAEWTIGRFRADLEIRLDNHQALWGYSDLSSDYDDERELDLNLDSEWQWLSNILQQWVEQARNGAIRHSRESGNPETYGN